MTRCVITGVAAGIGRALALEFGESGAEIVGVDRDAERLAALEEELRVAGIQAVMHCADLATEEGRESTVSFLSSARPLDIVIHNAGINCVGPFGASDWVHQKRVVEVNLTAPIMLSAQLIVREALAPRATWVFLSSLSKYVSYPGAAVYAATKDGLASYARSLAAARAPRGERVLTVFPGPTRTAHARRYSPPGSSEEQRMTPEELAGRIGRAVRRRQRVLIPGVGNRVLALFGNCLPRVAERVMKKVILDKL